MRRLLLVLFSIVISGCASVKNVKDSVVLQQDEGLMLVNFDSNYYNYKVSIINKKNLTVASAVFDIRQNDNLRVIKLAAGEYTWRGVYLGTQAAEFRDVYDFTIKGDSVNYVGDLKIMIENGGVRLAFFDNDSTIATFKKRFPIIASNRKIEKSLTRMPSKD